MTMHLLPPMYSTTGKKKGRAKFRTAEAVYNAFKQWLAWTALATK